MTENRRHAGTHALVDFLDRDAGGEAFDAVLDHRLRCDSFDAAFHFQSRHGLDLDFHFLAGLKANDVGLVDVRVDDHFVEVGDGHHLGAAVEPAAAGDGLPERNRPGQHGAIERREDFGFAKTIIEQLQGGVGAGEDVGGEFEFGPGVFKDFLRDEVVRESCCERR